MPKTYLSNSVEIPSNMIDLILRIGLLGKFDKQKYAQLLIHI